MVTEYLKRTMRLIFGLFLYAFGSYLGIQANVGLAPWEAFSVGVSMRTGLLYGDVVVLTGVVLIILGWIFKEKIGFGTILNALLIGKFVDFFNWMDIVPKVENFPLGVVVLLLGQMIICFASFFYIGASLGCGPRDTLMVLLGKVFARIPIGMVRGLLEGTVLLIGWILGAKVGIGTVIAVFGIGTLLEYTFRLLRFDVKAVKHEDMRDTVQRLKRRTL